MRLLLPCIILLAGLIAIPGGSAHGQPVLHTDWYVATFGSDQNDCNSPKTACATVRVILDNSQFPPGTTIYVERGPYHNPTQTEESVLIDRDVILSGGWDSTFKQQTGYSFFHGDRQIGITVASGVSAEFYRISSSGGEFDPRDTKDVTSWDKGGLRNFGTLVYNNSGANGFFGYAISNSGTMTITEGEFTATYGTGIENYGILRMIGSSVDSVRADVGCAGITNSGTLIMESSLVSDNRSRYGNGGLCNSGDAVIWNSMIVDNASSDPVPYAGGGIVNYGTLWLINSVVSENYGHTADLYNGGTVYLANSTIRQTLLPSVQNLPEGSIYSRNSIFSNCTGLIESDGHNLLADSEECDWQAGTGDILDRDPLLDETLTPQLNSPAINAGNPAGCIAWDGTPLETDGHGNPRWRECDIGVYEYIPPAGEIFTRRLPLINRAGE